MQGGGPQGSLPSCIIKCHHFAQSCGSTKPCMHKKNNRMHPALHISDYFTNAKKHSELCTVNVANKCHECHK
eukprot:1140006-Pelagomonas_calceolata.AAC.8